MFSGTYTALITPLNAQKNIDIAALENLVEEQIAAGVDGIVVVGTTGEKPTLTVEEDQKIAEIVVKKAAGRVKVIYGSGSNCTETAVNDTLFAQKIGADAALVVTPYYNKPSQEGLFLHFQKIAEACPDFPIILYDVPGRTGVRLAEETILALAKIPNIIGIKDAAGVLEDTQKLLQKLPKDFVLLSGEDALTVEIIRAGGHGVISVASNLFPAEIAEMVTHARTGNFEAAEEIEEKMKECFSLCFCESNPIPIKFLLSEQGKCALEYRLPLSPPSTENQEKLRIFLQKSFS